MASSSRLQIVVRHLYKFPAAMPAPIVLASIVLPMVMAAAAKSDTKPPDATLFTRLDADANGLLTNQEVPSEHRVLFARLIRRADANHDQSLTRDEFLAGLTPERAEKPLEEKPPAEFPGADAIRWLLLSMDANMDGSITQAEVPEKFRAAFQAMAGSVDRDNSGTIDRPELNQGGRFLSNIAIRFAEQQQVDVAAELKKLEQSQGAAIGRFEGQRGPQPRVGLALGNPQQAPQTFAQLDANRDGQVTRAEVPEPALELFQQIVRVADSDGNGRLSQQEFVAGVRQVAGRRGGPRAGMRAGAPRGRRGGPQTPLEALGRGANAADGAGQMDAMPGGDK